jgi:hypothetical protein
MVVSGVSGGPEISTAENSTSGIMSDKAGLGMAESSNASGDFGAATKAFKEAEEKREKLRNVSPLGTETVTNEIDPLKPTETEPPQQADQATSPAESKLEPVAPEVSSVNKPDSGDPTSSFVWPDLKNNIGIEPVKSEPPVASEKQEATVATGANLGDAFPPANPPENLDISAAAATDQSAEKPEDEQPTEVAEPPVVPEAAAVTDIAAIAEPEPVVKASTATEQLKSQIQEDEDKLRNNNLEIINSIEEDGKQNGIYFITIGNNNPDPKLDTRTIIFPEPITDEGAKKIVALSSQYGELIFKSSEILVDDLKKRFDESKELKDEREKTSKEQLVKDKNGKFSLEMHSHNSKKLETHGLNFLPSDISLLQEAYTKNRENSEIVKLTRKKEALKKKTANSEAFLKILQNKTSTASNTNSSA